MKKIAIFASGSGSNAENIINYFKNDTENVVNTALSTRKARQQTPALWSA